MLIKQKQNWRNYVCKTYFTHSEVMCSSQSFAVKPLLSINLLTFWGVGVSSLIRIFLEENQSRVNRFTARHIENVCCQHRGHSMYKVQAVCYNYIFNQDLLGLSFVSHVIELSTRSSISTSTPNTWLHLFVSIKEAYRVLT